MRSVKINEEKCDGCGLCVKACHEGALSIIDGKAVLSKGWLCDGLGDCLPACPQNAIDFVDLPDTPIMAGGDVQWPIKLELVSERNPLFDGKHILFASDCTAFTDRTLLDRLCKDNVKIIGCPKLGNVDQEKLNSIFAKNDILSVDIVKMEVPCCNPWANKITTAIENSGKNIPVKIHIIGRNGKVRA